MYNNTTILPLSVVVWATEDNHQYEDKCKHDDDDDIYQTEMATWYAEGYIMIQPYTNKCDCEGMYLNWLIEIVLINILSKYST